MLPYDPALIGKKFDFFAKIDFEEKFNKVISKEKYENEI
jgi:hypothetical protein